MDDSVKPAVRDAWSILTQVLANRAWVWITLGVVTLVLLVLGLLVPLFARGSTTSLLLLALVIVGVEVVRNIALREVPQQR